MIPPTMSEAMLITRPVLMSFFVCPFTGAHHTGFVYASLRMDTLSLSVTMRIDMAAENAVNAKSLKAFADHMCLRSRKQEFLRSEYFKLLIESKAEASLISSLRYFGVGALVNGP